MRPREILILLCTLGLLAAKPFSPQKPVGRSSQIAGRRPTDYVATYQRGLTDENRTRVSNGAPATPGQLPWQAALVSAGWLPKDAVFCGGAVIGKRWIVTAAHCFPRGTMENSQYVFVGPVNLEDEEKGQALQISRIYPHPQFDWGTLDNDIALLFLSEDVDRLKATPVDLLEPQNENAVEAPTHKGRVSGWGQVGENQPKSATLKYVDVPFQDRKACATNYKRVNKGYVVTDNMVCAGSDQSDQGDACKGDSGGPLIVPLGHEFRLAGAVSWGTGCSRAGLYGVYARVPNYIPWISSYMTKPIDQLPPSPPITGSLYEKGRYRSSIEGTASTPSLAPVKPEWQLHIDWSTGNSDAFGSTDCPEKYPFPGCILSGGRACLMNHAIPLAKHNECSEAFSVTLVTQCHNPEAQAALKTAGTAKVCNYLKSMQPLD